MKKGDINKTKQKKRNPLKDKPFQFMTSSETHCQDRGDRKL